MVGELLDQKLKSFCFSKRNVPWIKDMSFDASGGREVK
jgi:hypothetical protein